MAFRRRLILTGKGTQYPPPTPSLHSISAAIDNVAAKTALALRPAIANNRPVKDRTGVRHGSLGL